MTTTCQRLLDATATDAGQRLLVAVLAIALESEDALRTCPVLVSEGR